MFKSIFAVLLAASLLYAASDSTMSRYQNGVTNFAGVIAQQGPYSYIHTVTAAQLAAADWTPPAGVTTMFVEIAIGGHLRVATWSDTAVLNCTDYDFKPVGARKIFASGTTCDSITVYGKR